MSVPEFNGKALAPVKYYSRANCVQSKDSLYESSKVSSLWDDNIIVSNYLKADLEKNVYSYNEKKVHGRLYVNKWGRVESKPTKASKAEEELLQIRKEMKQYISFLETL